MPQHKPKRKKKGATPPPTSVSGSRKKQQGGGRSRDPWKYYMKELEKVHKDNLDKLLELRYDNVGIRSSQIGALIQLLIDKGVLPEDV